MHQSHLVSELRQPGACDFQCRCVAIQAYELPPGPEPPDDFNCVPPEPHGRIYVKSVGLYCQPVDRLFDEHRRVLLIQLNPQVSEYLPLFFRHLVLAHMLSMNRVWFQTSRYVSCPITSTSPFICAASRSTAGIRTLPCPSISTT